MQELQARVCVPYSISQEHRALSNAVERFVQDKRLGELAQLAASGHEPDGAAPDFWPDFASLGWLGLHIDERWGGQGYGLSETAVVLEAAGAANAPGPLLSTLIASAVIQLAGSQEQQAALLPGLADGTMVGGLGLLSQSAASSSGLLAVDSLTSDGGPETSFFLVSVEEEDLLIVRPGDAGITVEPRSGIDPIRATCLLSINAARISDGRLLPGAQPLARRIAWALAAAEAAGGIRACAEMAVNYAKVRKQFGRPIGSFQAVKHHCANLHIDQELAAAAAWDATRPASAEDEACLAAASASLVALPGYVRSAERNIQVHGGIGYTWEHRAHLYLKRACGLRALYLQEHIATREINRLVAAGVERQATLDLPPSAELYRQTVGEFVTGIHGLGAAEQRDALVNSGYLVPHWPKPWGLDAGPVEQLVIEQVLPAEMQIDMGITGWVAQTLAQHASPAQKERWVRPTLLGSLKWCQLFSEPNAGSDAAGVQTRAGRAEGGWQVKGQKVWTSGAHDSDWGLATIRTDPAAPKHAGITLMAIKMNQPGVTVRPLRDLTGRSLFNEVFLDDVFIEDRDVVGDVGRGWTLALATLANERTTIGGRAHDERSARHLLGRVWAAGAMLGPAFARDVAELLAEEHAGRVLRLRQAARSVEAGAAVGGGNVAKLIAGEHTQRVTEVGMRLSAEHGGAVGDDQLIQLFLYSRCLTIAGGTSEIIRNQIAERTLGLPRDPAPVAIKE
jgi:alkylation response protein AidB-like acyl-CoA dehydrogenase